MAVLVLLTVLSFQLIHALPEQGIFTRTFIKEDDLSLPFGVHKSMFNNSAISLKINCEGTNDQFKVTWLLRKSPCAEEYIDVEYSNDRLVYYLNRPEVDQFNFGYEKVHYLAHEQMVSCDHLLHMDNIPANEWQDVDAIFANPSLVNGTAEQVQQKQEKNVNGAKNRRKRADDSQKDKGSSTPQRAEDDKKKDDEKKTEVSKTSLQRYPATPDKNQIAKTTQDGIYLFLIHFDFNQATLSENFKLNVTVSMKGSYGYLSAQDWPLLPFYGVMCGVYVIYGLIWLVLLFCNWRDLLRIQFWIGGVIFLGMLEKAVFFAEYESINASGQSVRGAVIFAELVSCMKRTLARMLVVIVSLGFGIVKPRLGPMLHRVLGMGALYMILGSVEGILRVTKHKSDTSKQLLLASIPLAVLDAAICWWVFTSLVQTTRTLRLRRNLVKLSLYRHFTNTLIFAVLASVAFMIWSIKQHKMVTCLTDWKELWVDDAFWHLLFSVILLVIMVLWRPTANNQRYAFSPLLDAADDEAEEPMISDAFDGMKMRGAGKQSSTSPHQRGEGKSKADEDLKWIEENIPTSVTDTALPSLLDSDEEIMTTKFEMSKME